MYSKEQDQCDTTIRAASAAHKAGGSQPRTASDAAGTVMAKRGEAVICAVEAADTLVVPSAVRTSVPGPSRSGRSCMDSVREAATAACAGHGRGAVTSGPQRS